MSKFWRHRIARVPEIWWIVTGRKRYGREPLVIRRSWRLGNYQPSIKHQKIGKYAKWGVNMKWILMVYLGLGGGFSAEFSSEVACRSAGQKYMALARQSPVSFICEPAG